MPRHVGACVSRFDSGHHLREVADFQQADAQQLQVKTFAAHQIAGTRRAHKAARAVVCLDGEKLLHLVVPYVSADSPADAAAREIVPRLHRESAVRSANGRVGNREAQKLTDAGRVAQKAADVGGGQIARDAARKIASRVDGDGRLSLRRVIFQARRVVAARLACCIFRCSCIDRQLGAVFVLRQLAQFLLRRSGQVNAVASAEEAARVAALRRNGEIAEELTAHDGRRRNAAQLQQRLIRALSEQSRQQSLDNAEQVVFVNQISAHAQQRAQHGAARKAARVVLRRADGDVALRVDGVVDAVAVGKRPRKAAEELAAVYIDVAVLNGAADQLRLRVHGSRHVDTQPTECLFDKRVSGDAGKAAAQLPREYIQVSAVFHCAVPYHGSAYTACESAYADFACLRGKGAVVDRAAADFGNHVACRDQLLQQQSVIEQDGNQIAESETRNGVEYIGERVAYHSQRVAEDVVTGFALHMTDKAALSDDFAFIFVIGFDCGDADILHLAVLYGRLSYDTSRKRARRQRGGVALARVKQSVEHISYAEVLADEKLQHGVENGAQTCRQALEHLVAYDIIRSLGLAERLAAVLGAVGDDIIVIVVRGAVYGRARCFEGGVAGNLSVARIRAELSLHRSVNQQTAHVVRLVKAGSRRRRNADALTVDFHGAQRAAFLAVLADPAVGEIIRIVVAVRLDLSVRLLIMRVAQCDVVVVIIDNGAVIQQ